MKTILVGIDGSAGSLKAAAMGRSLAERLDAKLVFLHASPPIFTPATLPPGAIRQMQLHDTQSVQDAARPIMEQAQKTGLKTEFVAMNDITPAEALVAAADRLDAWLVLVGDRGRQGVARMLLGSVADRVVHLCSRPVMVVK
jgi:nucleotide-binding universal stress UspA family protein